MASFNYLKSQQTAKRLIAKFGQVVVIRRPGIKSGPDNNPVIGAPTDTPIRAAVLGFSFKDKESTLIQETDKKVLASAFALDGSAIGAITTADKVVIGGAVHTIVTATVLSPGAIDVLWTLQVRA